MHRDIDGFGILRKNMFGMRINKFLVIFFFFKEKDNGRSYRYAYV